MDLIQNLNCRAEGKGILRNCDFAIPRLSSLSGDTFLRVNFPVGDEEVGEGEYLVARFCPHNYRQASILALADEDGFVILQDTSKRGKKSIILANFRAHENAIFDLAWMTSYTGDLNIVTASGDKTVAIWDAETLKRRCVIYCHEQSLRTVCSHPDIPGLLVTGGRDGKICIHDHRCDTSVPVSTIVGAHIKAENKKSHFKKGFNSPNQSVTSLVLKDEHCLISGGFTDGMVKVWDLRRTYSEHLRQPAPLHCLPVGATVTSLVLPPRDMLLYASGSSNAIICFDAINFNEKPVCKFVGHSTNPAYSSYLQASVSSCGRYLACGSTDWDVYLWPTRLQHATLKRDEEAGVPSVLPIARLEGHSDEVTCVQWSPQPNELKLVSLGDDSTHRIWRVGPNLEGDEKSKEPNCGFAKITDPSYFKSHAPKRFYASVIPESERTVVPHISSLPSFVDNPSSLVHKCSPRVPKQRTNWLSALSPQNAIPSAGKVVKLKRPTNGTKRKSSKKLQLLSPHLKAVLKPRTPKI